LLIEKPVYTTDVSPNGVLPIWVNTANGHVLEPSAILATHFADFFNQYRDLISELSSYFRVKDKNNLFRWELLNYLFWTPCPALPVLPAGLPPVLAFSISHCSMCLLTIVDPFRLAIEGNEEISHLYLQVLESK
jgi:hypothetical protein